METSSSFILSVAANVVAHCIGKWLDEQFKAGKHESPASKTPPVRHYRGRFAAHR